MELEEKIASLKAKMKKLNPDTAMYMGYQNILGELERKRPVKLHKDTGPTCEGCQ